MLWRLQQVLPKLVSYLRTLSQFITVCYVYSISVCTHYLWTGFIGTYVQVQLWLVHYIIHYADIHLCVHCMNTMHTFHALHRHSLNHLFQYETDHWIHCIDQLLKFNCGTAKTTLWLHLLTWTGKSLQYPGKILFSDFTSFLKLLHCFIDCLQHLLIIYRGKLHCKVSISCHLKSVI